MRTHGCCQAAVGLLMLACGLVSFASDATAPLPHIVLVGDSTVTEDSGWGKGFRHFLADGVRCTNMARGGRSSKSYRDEGHWQDALELKGDYYLLQFGHNDQPGKGPKRETDPDTTFTANMARYVDEVRAIGGKPVLITSLTRRGFSKDDPARIASTLTPWADAVKRLAAEKQVPLIDLHASSIAFCEKLGPEGTAAYNITKPDGSIDITHLDAKGSEAFARLVVDGLREAVPDLALLLRAEPGPVTISDVSYGKAGDENLLLDVRLPCRARHAPVVIVVHGGGWCDGDKANVGQIGRGADISPLFGPLAEAGFVCFSINYRLAPEHRWPACLDDVATAIRWVKNHAADYGGNPKRIAIMGHSAGGQLVCQAATLVDDSIRVQAVVGCAPVTNHEQELPRRGGLSTSLQNVLDRPHELTPESLGLLRALSPVNHVRAGLPPFLLIHGDADTTVPIEQSRDFRDRLAGEGIRCDLIEIPGAGHRLTEWKAKAADWDTRMTAWLLDVLDD